ncbi:MAG: hypothetical protein M3P82_01925 [Bacteroidota bacterium]|nr:hypothetical protein [Bacteroidota bacterium]
MKQPVRSFLLFITILSSVIFSNCTGTSPEYSRYQSLLKNQIQEMANVLNAGHYKEFMTNYVSPSYISTMGGVDAALLNFDNSKQQSLYRALNAARNIEPLYEANSKTMTYISSDLSRPIVFRLQGGKWYLTDDMFL